MNYKHTEKLFFKKYAYKIAIRTPVASFFRTKDLSKLKDNLVQSYSKFTDKRKRIQFSAWSNHWASLDDVYIAERIVEVLENMDTYGLRVEGHTLGIFFNNDTYIENILNINNIAIEEIFLPKNEKIKNFLCANPLAIIKPDYTHRYKVHVKPLYGNSNAFVDWAKKYNKIKLVGSNSYRYEAYFYVEDERTLTVCRLYLNTNIRKVEEIYKESEI